MKVKNRYICLFYVIVLSLFLAIPSFAEANRVTDEADLLSSEEEMKLQETINQLAGRLQVDIGIVTTDDAHGKSAEEYLKDFRDAGVFGQDLSEKYLTDILLLIDMDNREAYILPDTKNEVYFPDDVIDLMLDEIYKGLEKDDFYQSGTIFLEQVERYRIKAGESRVFDEYDLFSVSEETGLQNLIDEISRETRFDIVIVTTGDTEGKSSKLYAENFYESHDFGSSYSKLLTSGILFLIDKDNNNLHITLGRTNEKSFTEQSINNMLDDINEYAEKDDYYGAGQEFLRGVRKYGGTGGAREPMTLGTRIVSALLIAMGIAAVVVGIMAASMKVGEKPGAMTYLKDQRIEIKQREDRFIHTTVSTRRIPKTPPPSSGNSYRGSGRSMGGSSGGSRSSGGRGRKF